MSALNKRVLVLNRGWQPISITTVRHALVMVYQGTARILHEASYQSFDFDGWRRHSASGAIPDLCIRGLDWYVDIPQVIILQRYMGLHHRQVRLTRRNLFLRDGFACQYCRRKLGASLLTMDHIQPRSRKGRTIWENVVTACRPCNLKKRDMTLEQAGMTLLRKPRRPRWYELGLRQADGKVPPAWRAFLICGSEVSHVA